CGASWAAKFARKRGAGICFLANIAPHFNQNSIADQWLASCSGRTKLAAAPAAAAWAWWRKDMLSTILVGMAVYLALKLGVGW
ncbi:AzlD domain-containing protein, partial [Aquabacterium parvum]|uniref:AzlD domain-containing protein n=1 Tax=Aquabacterium parvum TaxID=70584 RepID=UPI0019103FC4